MRKNRCLVLWVTGIVSFLFLFWSLYTSIPFTFLKVASVGGVLLLLLILSLGIKWGKWVALLLTSLLIVGGVWPARTANTAQLRNRYVVALDAYIGTPYVWGGENGRGIDCSGLIRRAMMDTLLSQGWRDKNPALWREAVTLWWYDCSASAMKSGYSGRIEPLFTAKNLNTLDTSRLHVGDLAVLQSGVHVLAFVGGKTWIQADPNLANGGDKVIKTTVPSRNGWFGQRVVICRWKNLS